jgi:hypothetical protein
LECSLTPGTLWLSLKGHDDMSVEILGAKDKSDLFLAACQLKLVIEAPTAGVSA